MNAYLRKLVCLILFACSAALPAAVPVHVWEKQELTFTAARNYANPYTDVVAHKYAPRVDTKSIEAPVSRARSQSPGGAKEKECRDDYKVRA